MKTTPGLFVKMPLAKSLSGLGFLLVIASGCVSKSHVAKKAPDPAPPVVGAAEILRREAVKTRSRELFDSGKYKNSSDAKRAAEQEYPPVADAMSNSSLQAPEYYRWKQQQAVQSKFEADLDKMKRKS